MCLMGDGVEEKQSALVSTLIIKLDCRSPLGHGTDIERFTLGTNVETGVGLARTCVTHG